MTLPEPTELDRTTVLDIPVDLPGWWSPLIERLPTVSGAELSRFSPPATGGRASSVLMLLGQGPAGPDVLLIERAATLALARGAAGLPGGRLDPEDAGPVAAALREAVEETGLDPAGVAVVATLPALWLPVSASVVTPVLAWWRTPSPVRAVDAAEVATVRRVPLAELAAPERRSRLRHPSGMLGPAFVIDGVLIWGFTAGLLDRLLELSGFHRPWPQDRYTDLPPEILARAAQDRASAVAAGLVLPPVGGTGTATP